MGKIDCTNKTEIKVRLDHFTMWICFVGRKFDDNDTAATINDRPFVRKMVKFLLLPNKKLLNLGCSLKL